MTNIDEKELIKKTGSTFKLGIKHSNWYKKKMKVFGH